ncbi:ABC transporter ATP-binding protein [[Acholeplasma] multilocale]|uniref:ABC transporter ATP-binding protein n=1 Tax=[Acholeplasma] multilocale TaxID=264638 RepID=UPI00047A203F|nr:ABC transporter ATP-binding protein [[Acholeplasma] multilocale]
MKTNNNKVIEINDLTKAYPNGYGIFNVSLTVNKGEVFGYLGPNGAGKSTTIRAIMGYIKPTSGDCKIFGMDSWKESAKIQTSIGYLPGEITFPEYMTGTEFIKLMFNLRKMDNWEYVEDMIKYWEFNADQKIKKMSKGMKQKVGLIVAFMSDPKLIILDEPTTGLDPLMQQKFIDLVNKFKANGTTFIMSSHIFEEIEKTCDKVAMVKSGRVIANFDIEQYKNSIDKKYIVEFEKGFEIEGFGKEKIKGNEYMYIVPREEVPTFLKLISETKVVMISEEVFSIEKNFMKYYETGGQKNV